MSSSKGGGLLVLQEAEGIQRVVGPEEYPLKLVTGGEDSKKKLLLIPPHQLRQGDEPDADFGVGADPPVYHSKAPPPYREPPKHSNQVIAPIIRVDTTVNPGSSMPQFAEIRRAESDCEFVSVSFQQDLEYNGLYVGKGLQSAAHKQVEEVFGVNNWMLQVPALYSFSREHMALDEVNASDARELSKAQLVERTVLKRPPKINRTSKPSKNNPYKYN
jgi:hypothetical protein